MAMEMVTVSMATETTSILMGKVLRYDVPEKHRQEKGATVLHVWVASTIN